MPNELDIFHNDAFSLVELTQAINIVPNNYGRIGQLGLFKPVPIPTTTVSVEYKQGVLNLITSAERGGPAPKHETGKRHKKSFTVPHFPLEDFVTADEVQNVRAFGTANRLQSVMSVVNGRQVEMAPKHFITWEFLKAGALRGVILDADGSVLLDLFTEFGVTEKVVAFDFAGAAKGEVAAACRAVSRHIEDNLKGEIMGSIRALCSPEFFDGLISHEDCEKAYTDQQGAQTLKKDMRRGFTFQGITFEEYRGQAQNADGTIYKFIPESGARFFPMGTLSTFRDYMAPADFLETVNTPGRPMYSKIAIDEEFQRWVKIHSQSNRLPICHRPAVLVKGTA